MPKPEITNWKMRSVNRRMESGSNGAHTDDVAFFFLTAARACFFLALCVTVSTGSQAAGWDDLNYDQDSYYSYGLLSHGQTYAGIPACSGGTTTQTATEGSFDDGFSVYPPNADLCWVISPPGEGILKISFTAFQVEANAGDLVHVYECETADCSESSPTLISNVLGLGTVIAATGRAKVTFTSDFSVQYSGFNATWTFCNLVGYNFNSTSNECIDVDECASNTHNCSEVCGLWLQRIFASKLQTQQKATERRWS